MGGLRRITDSLCDFDFDRHATARTAIAKGMSDGAGRRHDQATAVAAPQHPRCRPVVDRRPCDGRSLWRSLILMQRQWRDVGDAPRAAAEWAQEIRDIRHAKLSTSNRAALLSVSTVLFGIGCVTSWLAFSRGSSVRMSLSALGYSAFSVLCLTLLLRHDAGTARISSKMVAIAVRFTPPAL